MSFRATIKGLVHQDLFFLEPSARQAFKYALPDDSLRQKFAQNGHPLGPHLEIVSRRFRKWKLSDGKAAYLVKDRGDHLVVVLEKHPRICRLIEDVWYEAKPRYWDFRWRLRRWCSQQIWTLEKRWVDKPKKLLVNIGAGVWYVRDWKVLEYHGDWYRYASSFVDFHHDLTSNNPFPFADGSVYLFYSEHVFEHLKDEWCAHIFREAYRSLASGGGFRIVVPDAGLIFDRLLKKDTDFFKSWMERDNASLAESFRTLVGQARTPLDEEDFAQRLSTMSKEAFLDWCKPGVGIRPEADWRAHQLV